MTTKQNSSYSLKKRIFNTLLNLQLLPKVSIYHNNIANPDEKIFEFDNIWITHPQEYVPNFKFEWSEHKQHYRVYIELAYTDKQKERAGYCICTISNGLVASGFATLYMFLHKNRANNKEAAYSAT